MSSHNFFFSFLSSRFAGETIKVDTDFFIILLGIFHKLQSSYSFTDIIFYKSDPKNRIRVSLKAITERLGQAMYQALPFLHAFTGSDTTSTF